MLSALAGSLSQQEGQAWRGASWADLTPDRISPRPDWPSSCLGGEGPVGPRIPPRNGTHFSAAGVGTGIP